MEYESINSIEITNQCVVLCDLEKYAGPQSKSWAVFRGSQDEIGENVAAFLGNHEVERIDDFGGVSGTCLCEGEKYLESPPKIKGRAAIFSFTPKKKLFMEGAEMARVAAQSGYKGLVITVQKHDKYGKVWVLLGILRKIKGVLTYYEDTNTVIDELKQAAENEKIVAVHVKSPGYEAYTSKFADRVVDQSQYRAEAFV